MINRRTFLKLTVLLPFVPVETETQIPKENVGLVFPFVFAENKNKVTSVDIVRFEKDT